ncbi:MAG: hypothetical protein HGA97_07285 [Chlorobiaceae bacterium]|nr:hypothetical protein [Chlorobiaceae bacterium]
MGLANEMKSLSEEMFASFKGRVKDNEELVVNVEKKLQQYRDEQNKRAENIGIDAAELKKNLEEGEKERVKDYDQLISVICKDIKDIEEDVMNSKSATNTLISDFTKSRKVLADELDKQLSDENEKRLKNEQIRIAEYEIYITKISDEVSGIFKYTNEMLAKFGSEHKEMSEELKAELRKARKERFEHTQELIQTIQGRIKDISNENRMAALKLRKDLDEGDAERLKAFNGLFERISSEVEQLRKSTTELLGNYSDDRAQGAKHWAEMQEKIAAIRAGEKVNNIQISVPETKEVKPETEVATVKVMPVAVEKAPVAVVEIPVEKEQITLEERILQYINSHIEGVKVSDMEEPLHETRMKIGFAAKCLLDAGKVSKVENLYYPVKKINK